MYVYELKALYDEWAKTLPPEKTLVSTWTKENTISMRS